MAEACIATTTTESKYGEHSDHSSYDDKVPIASAGNTKPAGSSSTPLASETRLVAAETPARVSPSLFAKLPGELRNRIYRAYFDMFAEEKEQSTIARDAFFSMYGEERLKMSADIMQKSAEVTEKAANIKKTLPPFLNVLHTDHMIRSEAGSIFDKEYLSIDRFASECDLPGDMWARIRSICALVAIRNVSLPLSITCTKRASGTYTPQRLFLNVILRIIFDGRSDVVFQAFTPQQDGEHIFFSKKGELGMEMRAGQDYLVQTKDNFDMCSASDRTVCISGPLAKLYWPRCSWTELIDFR